MRGVHWRRGLIAALLATPLLAFGGASSAPNTPLDRYLDGLKSLRTGFSQTVVDAHGNQVEAGTGTLIVQRPGKFRWDYHARSEQAVTTGIGDQSAPPPDTASRPGDTADDAHGQLLVADGRNLWFYDRELAQVTVKPMAAALSATPVVLLSGAGTPLRDSFDVHSDGARDGLDWVSVKPHDAAADFTQAQLGFSHDQLVRMVVSDRLGQTVQFDFSHAERNVAIDAALLKFKPPSGVDVIGKPQG